MNKYEITEIIDNLDRTKFPSRNQYYVARSRMKKRLTNNQINPNSLEFCLLQQLIKNKQMIKNIQVLMKKDLVLEEDNCQDFDIDF